MTDWEAMIAWVVVLLADDEQVAREASRSDLGDRPQTLDGEHWQWEGTNHDRVIAIDPMTDEIVGDSLGEGYLPVALRSVEQYPTDSVGNLSHFVIPHAEEVPAVCGMHIARWDPARVLAEAAAKRQRLDWIAGEMADDPTDETAQWLARLEALPYADRSGYREEWRA